MRSLHLLWFCHCRALFGEGLNWAGCAMIILLGQQRHFEALDFSYHLMRIHKVDAMDKNCNGVVSTYTVCSPVNVASGGDIVFTLCCFVFVSVHYIIITMTSLLHKQVVHCLWRQHSSTARRAANAIADAIAIALWKDQCQSIIF